MPHDTRDPTLRRALERHEVAVNEEPVKEAVRSYMSAYAPFYDAQGAFVGVIGVDMWVRDLDARIARDSSGRHRRVRRRRPAVAAHRLRGVPPEPHRSAFTARDRPSHPRAAG